MINDTCTNYVAMGKKYLTERYTSEAAAMIMTYRYFSATIPCNLEISSKEEDMKEHVDFYIHIGTNIIPCQVKATDNKPGNVNFTCPTTDLNTDKELLLIFINRVTEKVYVISKSKLKMILNKVENKNLYRSMGSYILIYKDLFDSYADKKINGETICKEWHLSEVEIALLKDDSYSLQFLSLLTNNKYQYQFILKKIQEKTQ